MVSEIGRMNRMIVYNRALQTRLNQAAEQVSSGKKYSSLGEMGARAFDSLQLRQELSRAESYKANSATLQSRGKAAVLVGEKIGSAVAELANQVVGTPRARLAIDGAQILRDLARNALGEVVGLLNTKYEGRYIYASNDTANKPISDASLNAFDSAIRDQVGKITVPGITVADITDPVGGTKHIAASDTAYSATFAAASPNGMNAVPVADNLSIKIDVDAANPYFRDILRGLTTLANIPDYAAVAPEQRAEFEKLLDDAATTLTGAVGNLNTQMAKVGNSVNWADSISKRHSDIDVLLKQRLSEVEDVDPAEAITRLNALQNQMVAAYKATSMLSQMSLVNYL